MRTVIATNLRPFLVEMRRPTKVSCVREILAVSELVWRDGRSRLLANSLGRATRVKSGVFRTSPFEGPVWHRQSEARSLVEVGEGLSSRMNL